VQYRCLNLHAQRDGGPKLSLSVKNKWSLGWIKAWFYCRVPYLRHSEGRKSVFALRSRMSALHYTVKPEVKCSASDVNNTAFVRAAAMIGVHRAIEELLACGMYPLASSFGFTDVAIGTTVVSKVKTPLPPFPVEAVSAEDASRFMAKVETDVKRILGSYGPKEHDALMAANLPNGGCLNWVSKQMRVPYAPRSLPGTEAF
jgi:hypothetical protein